MVLGIAPALTEGQSLEYNTEAQVFAEHRRPDISVFYHDGASGEHLDGAFLVDSVGCFKTARGQRRYMGRMMARLQATTGMVFVAACSAGATSVESRAHNAATCSELLSVVQTQVGLIIPVIRGKDFFDKAGSVPTYNCAWDMALQELIEGCRLKSAR